MRQIKRSCEIFGLIALILFLLSCAQLPANFKMNPSYVLQDTDDTILAKQARENSVDNKHLSSMYLIGNGIDAFVVRASLLAMAEKSIDVQYYIWRSDLIGKLIFDGLLKAADRGVRVRILIDDMPIDKETESILYALDQHENIEVRLFNPFATRGFRLVDYITSPARINRRMHNKSFTVDNQFTVIGGRNIGNEYFSADDVSDFVDLDVLASGVIVGDVGKQFDAYWNSQVVYPVSVFDHNQATTEDLLLLRTDLNEFSRSNKNSQYHLDVKDSEMYQSIVRGSLDKDQKSRVFSGTVKVVYDDPKKGLGKTENDIVYLKNMVLSYVGDINKSFEIISPYFVPGSRGVEFLTGLVKKGVKVRVVTNSLSSSDVLIAQSGYSRRRYELLEGGVELYELKTRFKTKLSKSLRRGDKAKSALHAKTYIFDRQQVFIGSFNFDQRSANINAEVGVVFDVPEMAESIASFLFDKAVEDIAYQVKIADRDIVTADTEIEKGEVYWIETNNNKQSYYDKEPKTGFWRRFGQGFFSIMPIESQL